MKTTFTKWFTLVGVAALLGSCGVKMPQETPKSFETLTVQKQDITIPLRFSAKMKGTNDVTISPQVSGQLMEICVREGEQVKKGQKLFVIDQRNAQLELEAAEANLQAALAQESNAKLEFESNRNLFAKNIVSKYMLDDSENIYKQAQASVTQSQAAVNRAKVNLGYCTITAPVSGLIDEIPVRVGDQVGPGMQLTMVSGNDKMYAEFSLPESILEHAVANGFSLRKDLSLKDFPDVTFVMKNGTEYEHKGRVTTATGMVNATTGTIALKATFPNPDLNLYSGIQGSVVIPSEEKDVFVIPQVAVVKLQDKQLVYKVLEDSTVTAIDVTTQDTGDGEHFIALTGLAEGDRIVTVGANNVQEGQRVLFPEVKEEQN